MGATRNSLGDPLKSKVRSLQSRKRSVLYNLIYNLLNSKSELRLFRNLSFPNVPFNQNVLTFSSCHAPRYDRLQKTESKQSDFVHSREIGILRTNRDDLPSASTIVTVGGRIT